MLLTHYTQEPPEDPHGRAALLVRTVRPPLQPARQAVPARQVARRGRAGPLPLPGVGGVPHVLLQERQAKGARRLHAL